MNERNRSTK